MTITFYTFSKKRNSTAQPTGGTQYTGTLTGASGVLNPTVVMDFGNTYPGYNYAYISEFGRYYWINEMTSMGGGLWNVSMSVDVLATYKSAIGAANKYILRSASDYDGNIIDTKYPTKSSFTYPGVTQQQSWSPGWNDVTMGNYVIGVASNNAGTFGSVDVFVLDNSEFTALRNAIAPSLYYGNIQDADLQNLAISICNPMQYITFCKYYPFTVPRNSNNTTMNLGKIPVPDMHLITTPKVSNSHTFTLNAHPQAAARGAYMSQEPYTHRFLNWLPVGMIHLPALTAGMSSLLFAYEIDVISGTGDLRLYKSDNSYQDVYRTSFSVGTDVPIAQIVTGNPLKVISGAVSIASAGMSAIMGNVPGAIASGISGVADFMTASIPEVQAMKPGSGSLLSDPTVRITEYFSEVVDDDNPEFGRPLCKVKAISTLSGYVLCADGDIFASGATAPELAEIETFLTGGFFYA